MYERFVEIYDRVLAIALLPLVILTLISGLKVLRILIATIFLIEAVRLIKRIISNRKAIQIAEKGASNGTQR